MATQGNGARLAGAFAVVSVLVGAAWTTGCSSSNSDGRESCGADGVCNPDCPTGQFADPDCTGGSSSGGSGGSGGGGTGDCPVSDPSDPCEVCSMASCCDEFLACEASSECRSVLDCADGCQTDTCFSNCVSEYPSGALMVLDIYDCMDTYCYSECM